MLIVEIAAAILAIVAVLSWRYVLSFAAVLLGIWLCLEKPVLALIIAAIAIPGVVVTARAARREAERRRDEEQMRAWAAVTEAAAQERRLVRLGMRL
jgi:hypothetical protein